MKSGSAPTFALLAFAGAVQVPGTFDIAFTATSTKTPIVAGPAPLVIVERGIYSVYAIDAAGGGAHQIVFSTN